MKAIILIIPLCFGIVSCSKTYECYCVNEVSFKDTTKIGTVKGTPSRAKKLCRENCSGEEFFIK